MTTELVVNLHMHTPYSDGFGKHKEICQIALQQGIDIVIVTDHNVWVRELEGYFTEGKKRVMLLIGEEVHDRNRMPQKNHLLVLGANRELSGFAENPQRLIENAAHSGGLTFIAHPVDPELLIFGEQDISWENWEVFGFTGIELWNGFSELKARVKNRWQGIFYGLFPEFYPTGPLPEALKRWDDLLVNRPEKCVAIGGSDAHALPMKFAFLRRVIFPYSFHFQGVNTHILLEHELSGDFLRDRQKVLDALAGGHAFIGYDRPAPTRGFRFYAHGSEGTAMMGDDLLLGTGVTFQIRLPQRAECVLLRDGEVIQVWEEQEACTYMTTQPGIYRVESYITYLGKRRGWIFSNPIYVRG